MFRKFPRINGKEAAMLIECPVFYDCEASSLEGWPIEIGWAFLDRQSGQVQSEGHLIKPPSTWDLPNLWDPEAEILHGISIEHLMFHGHPPAEIAHRMNTVLAGSDLFSDDSKDEGWLRQLFDAAGLDPAFTIRRTTARAFVGQLAQEIGWDRAGYEAARREVNRIAPHAHRAEADARNWAILWQVISRI
jgi:hypothetical protein